MEYYSVFKRKEIIIHTAMVCQLEDIMPGEIIKKNIYYEFIYMRVSREVKFMETVSKMMVSRD